MVRYITADQLHSGKQWMPANTVLQINEMGCITGIFKKEELTGVAVEYIEGIICPGFINTHCHTELSHLKGKVKEGEGLISFVSAINKLRNDFTDLEKQRAIIQAFETMKSNGIVAIGDIANGLDSLKYRLNGAFHIHTFVESLGFTNEFAAQRFDHARKVLQEFMLQGEQAFHKKLKQSIVPHAPYSISSKIFELIARFPDNQVISIHNQELKAENEFYQYKKGGILGFHKDLNIDNDFFEATGKSSLQSYLPWIAGVESLILVHNTYTEEADLEYLKIMKSNIFLCLCPQANWYIERKLPSIPLFMKYDFPICLGTDSLASNHDLNIYSEIQKIQEHFPEISLEVLLQWATWNGACALQMESEIGSFSLGKKPGIVQIHQGKCRLILEA